MNFPCSVRDCKRSCSFGHGKTIVSVRLVSFVCLAAGRNAVSIRTAVSFLEVFTEATCLLAQRLFRLCLPLGINRRVCPVLLTLSAGRVEYSLHNWQGRDRCCLDRKRGWNLRFIQPNARHCVCFNARLPCCGNISVVLVQSLINIPDELL